MRSFKFVLPSPRDKTGSIRATRFLSLMYGQRPESRWIRERISPKGDTVRTQNIINFLNLLDVGHATSATVTLREALERCPFMAQIDVSEEQKNTYAVFMSYHDHDRKTFVSIYIPTLADVITCNMSSEIMRAMWGGPQLKKTIVFINKTMNWIGYEDR